jgi:predicted RNA methylase
MKFLVLARPRAGIQPSSLIFEEDLKYFDSLIAKKTADCIYSFVAGGGCSIVNAESHERVMEILRDEPGYAFLEWDVLPLCDYKQTIAKDIKVLRKQGM